MSTDLPRPVVPPCPLSAVADLLDRGGASPEAAGVAVTGVVLDSRRVHPGDLFAGLPGEHWHGASFARAAVAAGAAAVLTDAEGARLLGSAGLPVLVVDDPRARLGEVASLVYGHPGEHLLLLAVTGTNGKTTTSWLIESGLRAAGHRTGLIGTVQTRIADTVLPSVRTTPEAPDLHALLAVMRQSGVTAVALEVSSHALALGRVDGLVVDVAGFTQLGRDHLDLHGDLEAYFAAKAGLFTPQRSRRAVITVDDPGGQRLAAEATVPVLPLTAVPGGAPVPGRAVVTRATPRPGGGFAIDLSVPAAILDSIPGSLPGTGSPESLDLHVTVGLPGAFNVANAALAATMLLQAGVPAAAVAAGLAGAAPVPGRMEPVDLGQPFTAVVDYAHTPDALATVLRAVRPPGGRVWLVFGCGGDRDAAKRPAMGRVAARLADVVVVTDDNPRSEDPATIRAAVLAGVGEGIAGPRAPGARQVHEEGDRDTAIRWAVTQAAPGDVVVVAGKGHEAGQEIAGAVHPFDDRDAVTRALLHAGYSGRRNPVDGTGHAGG